MKWLCEAYNTCFQITVTGFDITGDTHVKKVIKNQILLHM